MATTRRFTTCLWFDSEAEEAARFYTGVFPNSRITAITRYGTEGFEQHHRPAGSVMVAAFELDGASFTALNGGPAFTFNEAISIQVNCSTQEEIDHYWNALSAGGDPNAQQCGWLKDRYGLSWQVVPSMMEEFFKGGDSAGSERVMAAMLKMKKLDIAALRKAGNRDWGLGTGDWGLGTGRGHERRPPGDLRLATDDWRLTPDA